ncbi:MAG TPA: sialidase family protein, partial [Longimicrobiaceae bacterium]|nr:sialidase family protein [Longimicrobiaceae bacterium]
GRDVDVTTGRKNEAECAIAASPVDPGYVYSLCCNSNRMMIGARSVDGGAHWQKGVGPKGDGPYPVPYCDPSIAWDDFGNLFVAYVGPQGELAVLLSVDDGDTFTKLKAFAGQSDQPTIVAGHASGYGGPLPVWLVWNRAREMFAAGILVTGRGAVGAFPAKAQPVPGTKDCSFGDVAISPGGAVVQACQMRDLPGDAPADILVSVDSDGLGMGGFTPATRSIATRVGWHDAIPPQPYRGIDAEVGLAFDANPASVSFGRLYAVYTGEKADPDGKDDSPDTDILVRFSNDLGTTWSDSVLVNDDGGTRSQFLPRIVTHPRTGDVMVCWHDARKLVNETEVRVFCALAAPAAGPPRFSQNLPVSDCPSTTSKEIPEFGDYAGLAFVGDAAHPIWADRSNSTGTNPDKTQTFDAYSDRVIPAAAISGVTVTCSH